MSKSQTLLTLKMKSLVYFSKGGPGSRGRRGANNYEWTTSLFAYLAEQVCQPDPPRSRVIPSKSLHGSERMTLHRPDGLAFYKLIPMVCTRCARRMRMLKMFFSWIIAALLYWNKPDFYFLGCMPIGFCKRVVEVIGRWLVHHFDGDWVVIGGDWWWLAGQAP